MSQQVENYIAEMKQVYYAILKKYVDKCTLSDIDIMFLRAYQRTIDNGIEIPID